MESEEYLLLKAEILWDANDWKEAALAYNTLEKKKKSTKWIEWKNSNSTRKDQRKRKQE
jgi:hypothetical protein